MNKNKNTYGYILLVTGMTKLILETVDSGGREPPSLDGFDQIDDGWQLNLSDYDQFIEDVTGVVIDTDISAREIKTIQSRMEGCIENYKRSGDCLCDNLDGYENVNSMETVRELSRFFRVFVAIRIENSVSA